MLCGSMRTLVLLALLLVAPPTWAQSLRCRFGPGATPAVTAPKKPHGSQIPIDTVVVLMQENRSFDHYFGQLRFQGQTHVKRIPPRSAFNPDPTNPSNPPISRFHQTRYCEVADLDHSWNGTHREYDNGRMDGFTAANVDATNDPTGSRTMGYYDTTDLPYYYALYSTFAIADRYFCSLLSQTFPNRFYLLAATSFGHIRNDIPMNFATDFSPPGGTIFEKLDNAGVTWKVYFAEVPFAGLFAYVRQHGANVKPIQQYFTDAAAGTLPQVAFVDPIFNFSGAFSRNQETDEHPPANVQVGEQFAKTVIDAIMASPQWYNSGTGRGAALFLTYDEHGGFWDHLPPPPACLPDNIPPMLQSGDEPGMFDRYGIRVPFVAVSPYSRKHYASHRTYDHTSILRFIETRFDLPALTRRDANADPLMRLFKFHRATFAVPPTLPPAPVDEAHRLQCSPSGAFIDPVEF